MIYLLDTHVLIWSITDTGKLSPVVSKTLKDAHNRVMVRAISFWEIALKYSLGKLDLEGILPEELPELSIQTGFELIPLMSDECATYHKLSSSWHKDPFDRMLIWQAIRRNLVLISKDPDMARYRSMNLKILW